MIPALVTLSLALAGAVFLWRRADAKAERERVALDRRGNVALAAIDAELEGLRSCCRRAIIALAKSGKAVSAAEIWAVARPRFSVLDREEMDGILKRWADHYGFTGEGSRPRAGR